MACQVKVLDDPIHRPQDIHPGKTVRPRLATPAETCQPPPMLSSRPVIFICAVSKELHSARDLVAKTLISLGYDPRWQDIAPTDTGDLLAVLRKWVDGSQAVIQIVGHRYGATS